MCGTYEVRFADGRESKYFYWDDVASRRLRPDMLTSEQALEQARAFARAEGIRAPRLARRTRGTAAGGLRSLPPQLAGLVEGPAMALSAILASLAQIIIDIG
jgi:hypothetical protein